MPYKTLKDTPAISNDNFNDYWELRVHIDPSVLKEDNPNNKINVIEQIVNNVFGAKMVGLKIYAIANQEDLNNGYDGALCHIGKDRTQVGKEVGIFLPNAAIEQLSANEYKELLLTLWQQLIANDIPLIYINLPGDQSIKVSKTQTSPFSFTSKNPNRDEWNDAHGILFKKFEACGQHPILEVEFSEEDLQKNQIQLPQNAVNESDKYLSEHYKQVVNDLDKEIQLVENTTSYHDLLFQDAKSIDVLHKLIDKYKTEVTDAAEDKRVAAQLQFMEDLKINIDFQNLIKGYPHNPDKNFSFVHEMSEINETIKRLTKERATILVQQIRNNFDLKIAEIVNDYKRHIDMTKLPPSLALLADEDHLKTLVAKNPAKMQTIFRQLALLQQEQEVNTPHYHAIQLLNEYKTSRSANNQEYFFGSFFRAFGACSRTEKLSAVDALINSLKTDDKFDSCHLRALRQGNLGALVKELKIDLSDYVAPAVRLSR